MSDVVEFAGVSLDLAGVHARVDAKLAPNG